MPRAFHPFTPEHWIAVGLGLLGMGLFLWFGLRGSRTQRRTTALLAGLNLSVYPLSKAAWMTMDFPTSLDNSMPFHLCDVAAFTAGFALITRRPILCALTYFWGLAATIQALATPAITVGFPAPPFVVFFIHHFAVVTAALYLPLVLGWRPKRPLWKSPLEVYGWSVIYLGFALAINQMLGTNFAFASRPPDNPSLIDHLGPWPWYLFWLLGIALAFYFLLTIPFLKSSGERKIDSEIS